ncbi:IS5 family transposase [Streptomyces sp. NPDC059467]|uniref:IS5 family transposase n=1 Tax=Streptomyces sp. NPDC059467 TaxID=3346844 RepID=UPI0036A54A9F
MAAALELATRIEPLLPDRTPKRGGRWRDHRQVIDVIAFKYRTGTPWTDLPERFGSRKGAHNRLRKSAANGTSEKVFTALLARADAEGDLDRAVAVAVDSTIVRAHHHATGAHRKGAPAGKPHDRALVRSRGGPTTKILLAADGRCRPLGFVVTPGQAGDAPAFVRVMGRLRVARPTGRPRTTPDLLLAAKAYSYRAIRSHPRRRGIRTVIPQPADQAANRKRLANRGGRPPAFDRKTCRQRNTVEPCINKLKQWRGLATRYDKTATI